jgi:hypothetical protein
MQDLSNEKILVLLFCLLFLAMPIHATTKKDECVYIKQKKITREACTSDRFYAVGFDFVFKSKKYNSFMAAYKPCQ